MNMMNTSNTSNTNTSTRGITISILGSATTQFGELWDRSLFSLAEEAILTALEDAEILPAQVDCVIVGNMASQAFTSQAHLGAYLTQIFPHHPTSWRVEAACASGGMAMISAIQALLSGESKTVVVVGGEKMTDLKQLKFYPEHRTSIKSHHQPFLRCMRCWQKNTCESMEQQVGISLVLR